MQHNNRFFTDREMRSLLRAVQQRALWGTLLDNLQEQATIEEIRSMRSQVMKLKEIAGKLTARGIATKKGNAHWSHQAIDRILKRGA